MQGSRQALGVEFSLLCCNGLDLLVVEVVGNPDLEVLELGCLRSLTHGSQGGQREDKSTRTSHGFD